MIPKPSEWTVLVVDDQDAVREVAVIVLEGRHVKVHQASNGEQAVAVLETLTPTAVLLDLAMPGMDGWDVVQHIRNTPRLAGIAVIAVTAYGIEYDLDTALEAGFDAYLVKPILPTTLVKEIQQCLEKKASGQD
jgi:CheY-like chemotaxis protein